MRVLINSVDYDLDVYFWRNRSNEKLEAMCYKKLGEFLHEYSCLKDFGIVVGREPISVYDEDEYYRIPVYIDINSFGELVELSNKLEHRLIIEDGKIIIYDGYIE